MKYFITLIIGQIIGYLFCIYIEVPDIIERRARDLDLMRYDGKTNKFIPKDSIFIQGVELNYLIQGTTKNK